MEDVKQQPGPAQELPLTRMQTQINQLNSSLATIRGITQESQVARTYIIGQIEALVWAVKLHDVG